MFTFEQNLGEVRARALWRKRLREKKDLELVGEPASQGACRGHRKRTVVDELEGSQLIGAGKRAGWQGWRVMKGL